MGLRELAEAAEVGLVVEEERIEILAESQRLCEEFGLEPQGTIASGALLLTLSPEDADELVGVLAAEQISSAIIGRVVPKAEGIRMESRGQARDLPVFARDEIAGLFSRETVRSVSDD